MGDNNRVSNNNSNNNAGEDVAENENTVRSIYTSILYHSNYGKSCAGKTNEELLAMKSFFEVCIRFEKEMTDEKSLGKDRNNKKRGGNGTMKKKAGRKMRLRKLYDAAIGFYENGNNNVSAWRKVLD